MMELEEGLAFQTYLTILKGVILFETRDTRLTPSEPDWLFRRRLCLLSASAVWAHLHS